MSKTALKEPENLELKVENAIERLRVAVVKSRSNPGIADEAARAVKNLNELYANHKEAFTAEDIRFTNVLRGYLGERLAAHQPKKTRTKKAKRKGDKLDHCWRCLTPIDERFIDNCPTCSEKAYQWRVCPICNACGCQRAGTVLI
jgi:hypothetical protein